MSVDETVSPPQSIPDPAPTPPAEQVTVVTKLPSDPTVLIPDPPPATILVSREELEETKVKFQSDLATLREQIGLLQARAAALEAQIAKIEPMVEARLSRTEVLVMKLQGEISTLTKTIVAKDKTEQATVTALGEIKGMLQTLVGQTPVTPPPPATT